MTFIDMPYIMGQNKEKEEKEWGNYSKICKLEEVVWYQELFLK